MKILVTTDGSECSSRAVEKCCDFFSAKDSNEIKILAVVEPVTPMAAEPFAVSADFYAQVEENLREQLKEAVSSAEKTIKEKLGDETAKISTEILTGSPKRIIVEEAEDFGADLVVVGSHGYGFLDRALLGSISDYVIHHVPCSVLVVR